MQVDQQRPVVVAQIGIVRDKGLDLGQDRFVPAQHRVEGYASVQGAFGFDRIRAKRCGDGLAFQRGADVFEEIGTFARGNLKGRLHQ